MKVRTLIVDDEPLARQRLRTLLRRDGDVEIVGECGNGREALAAISAERPELVFLDIQMPELDGFGLLSAVEPAMLPVVVLVTAYDQYTLQAFEAHALDYLLKPFPRQRFEAALARAKAQVRLERTAGGAAARLAGVIEAIVRERERPTRLVVKNAGRISFVKVDEVTWIEAEENYVRIHAGAASYLVHRTLKDVAAELDGERFVRIHRSAIVNVDCIRELQPMFHGDYTVVLRDGTRLTATRSPVNQLRRLLE
jgi:two-component system LytT family response regulator